MALYKKTFDDLRKNKDNDVGQMFLTSLDKLIKKNNELHDKISQLLVSQNLEKDNNELTDEN